PEALAATMDAIGRRARAAATAIADATPAAKRLALGAAATVLRGRMAAGVASAMAVAAARARRPIASMVAASASGPAVTGSSPGRRGG
ncbi:MAG: hypothetical protein ACKOUS_07580, partial [Alphaproteobacteria bacterium]